MALVTVRSPSFNSDGETEDEDGKSEYFFAGKDTALVLERKERPQNSERRLSTDSTRSTNSTQSNNSDIQQHLKSMFYLLRHEETLKMAVKLESHRPNRTRYLVIASRCCYRSSTGDRKHKNVRNNSSKVSMSSGTIARGSSAPQLTPADNRNNTRIQLHGLSQTSEIIENASDSIDDYDKRLSIISTCSSRQSVKCDLDKNKASGEGKCIDGIEESCLLGIDCNERTTIGLVVPILADTTIHLDGDGGFSVAVYGKTHIFKPVSVQAMWSALQTLHKVSQKARENNFYPGGPSHDWLNYYENRVKSDQSCLNEWNAMDSLESRRPPSPDAIRNKPTAKEETESVIKMKLKEIMMSVDLDEVTSKYIRGRLEEHLDMDLGEYKSFIDEEMLTILGQMDAPTEIFEHVYLGSEWNASNLEELQKNGVRHILNVTREIDNFFPGTFDYFNVRVYDDEKTNLLKHWDNTYRYITRAKAEGSKVLVHCKMGVSRSASVVIAYAMKAYNWEFQKALKHVKDRRNCIKPNKNFLNQLETYRGMLDAMKNKEKLQRSKSETNLKSTKDARLLPGSEPTPLIQALNQSKSKSASNGVETASEVGSCIDSVHNRRQPSIQKQRRVLRRSSSTSPKTIDSNIAIVMKQQSQSLENLTPERSIADEPKNVRFPGSNGENYSVTQNQVLHIQKHTPPLLTANVGMATIPPPSVRTIVHGLEAHQDARKTADDRKTLNLQFGRSISHDTSTRENIYAIGDSAGAVKNTNSPVWTASSKLITQTSNISAQQREDGVCGTNVSSLMRSRRDTTGCIMGTDTGDMFSSQLDNVFTSDEEKRHSRKTQSWAATSGSSGGIIMDPPQMHSNSGNNTTTKLGSNSSIDSSSSSVTNTSVAPPMYEGFMRTRTRQRELPSRHASWGSGDNRSGQPMRNSSWGSYDSNRNAFQLNSAAGTTAILEGKIHEVNMSNKTATHQPNNASLVSMEESQSGKHHHMGTVKRTKQKLEESTTQKKLCQEYDQENISTSDKIDSKGKGSNLYRSASATGATRNRNTHRCNSEEIVPPNYAITAIQRTAVRRSDGNRPLQSELISNASAESSYTISDIENKNTLPPESDYESTVSLRVSNKDPAITISEEQRVSGNVQILKKSFEAKAGGTTTTNTASQVQSAPAKKGHQSLPSSPVAQHVDHTSHTPTTTSTSSAKSMITAPTEKPLISISDNFEQSTRICAPLKSGNMSSTGISGGGNGGSGGSGGSTCSSTSSSSSVSESCDRNVKGLVHKYQTTTTAANTTSSTTTAGSTFTHVKPRPRSCYENPNMQKSLTGKRHDYSDCKPPPAPSKTTITTTATSSQPSYSQSSTTTTSSSSATQNEQHHQQQQQHHHQQQQQRRLQQHGKTHPLARLSLPKQSFNASAYNTM